MDTGGSLWYTQHISDDKEGYPMAENFDTVPLHPERWTDKAPFLGQWLWVLFWLAVPQAMASLLMSSLFSSQSLPYLLGQILQVVYLLGCGLVLLKLSSQIARYRTAGICFLVGGMINAAFSIIPVPAAGSALAVWGSLIIVAGGIFLMVGEYHEYMGHSELLEGVDWELSDKWRKLWKWYIGCFIALLSSIVVVTFSPFLGLLVTLAAIIGLLVIMIVKLVYLYRTAMIFRNWDAEPPLQAELPKADDPWNHPDQSSR